MARRLLSILIAVVATVLGYLAAWTGGVATAQTANTYRGGIDPASLALVLVGLIVLAIAALTIIMSSAGVIVVGAIHLLFGFVALALPPTGITDNFAPAYELIRAVFSVSRPFADGLYFSVPTGFGMLAGIVFLVGGLVARSRRSASTSASRVIAAAAAVVLGVPGVLLVLAGGGASYRRIVATLQPPAPLDILAIIAGMLLVAAVVVTVRWSSAGVLTLGAIVTVLGVVFLVAVPPAFGLASRISQELAMGVSAAGATGNVLILGVLLLAVGFGARVRARRAAAVVLAPADVLPPASV